MSDYDGVPAANRGSFRLGNLRPIFVRPLRCVHRDVIHESNHVACAGGSNVPTTGLVIVLDIERVCLANPVTSAGVVPVALADRPARAGVEGKSIRRHASPKLL